MGRANVSFKNSKSFANSEARLPLNLSAAHAISSSHAERRVAMAKKSKY